MQFYRYFPQTPYTFVGDDGRVTVIDVTNITAHVKIMEKLRSNITVLYDYVVQDGERPDTVAQRVYGSVNHTWLVLLLNNIFSLFDWPLASDEFTAYIIEKYGSLDKAKTCLYYRDVNNYKVDVITYTALSADRRGTPISAFDEEFTANEAKRNIRVVPAAFVGSLTNELKKLLA
jgi:hypothetical protein